MKSSTYALEGDARLWVDDNGRQRTDMRQVRLMVAGGGPTAYLIFDWQGTGFYETNEWSEGAETTRHFLGSDYSPIANYLAEKLGGWDQ